MGTQASKRSWAATKLNAAGGQAHAKPQTRFTTEEVLRREAIEIHKKKPEELAGDSKALYRAFNSLNVTALCLSGGGIRSASFGLGVIEALAVHPRRGRTPEGGVKQAEFASESLLSQFHYLSSVSGGGYIASWLSAWIARAQSGYAADVWPKLVGRRKDLEREPPEIEWLRAYSNYLTPRLGLFSADTWTAVALYIRNLILNWLVILPAACLLLLLVKAITIAMFWLSGLGHYYVTVGFVLVGMASIIWALGIALRNRPSCNPCRSDEMDGDAAPSPAAEDRLRDEGVGKRPGIDEAGFLWRCLLPALIAALFLSLYFKARSSVLADWHLSSTALAATITGVAIYALAWVVAWPPTTCRRHKGQPLVRHYWLRDFFDWIVAGGVYGAIIGVGVYLLAKHDVSLLIGRVLVSPEASKFLIAFIYGVPWIITAQLTAEMIFVGLSNWQPLSDGDREWFGRSTGWFTVAAIMWFAVTFLVLIGGHLVWDLVARYDSAKIGSVLLAAASGLFSTLGGKSDKSSATEQAARKSASLMKTLLPLAAIVFLVLLGLAISALMDYLLFDTSLIESALFTRPASEWGGDLMWLAIGFGVVAVVAFWAWKRVNINRFSIHALYRNRLIRAYLGASNPKRASNPFTGFDEDDNLNMAELWPPKDGQWRPFHVVNIALNVVNSQRLAWQERKAEPFTVTPLHCGTAAEGLGYRSTTEYGDKARGGISLGTALAISGAAASPNMGYNSSPLVTLLLALFNVRLGWWLGNPGPDGERSYGRDGPRVAIKPFVAEMFGLTTDKGNYVYLSDGGHFENLGLYEMIRRRCRCIVISDAGCDPEYGFEDLGNAVRKIAIDLGVYISFSELREIKRRAKDNTVITGAYYALGEIDYKTAPEWHDEPEAAENGYILYVKPSYLGTESAGIVAYATAHAPFPHETTADQFFSESQFESYRTLGFEIMDSVLRTATQNRDTIAAAEAIRSTGPRPPSGRILGELIAALDPVTLRDAEIALQPRFKVAKALQDLDEEDVGEMRRVLTGLR
jgi:hypothetical protein